MSSEVCFWVYMVPMGSIRTIPMVILQTRVNNWKDLSMEGWMMFSLIL